MMQTIGEIIQAFLIGILALFGVGCVFALIFLVALVTRLEREDAEKRQEELPWTCLILFGRCPNPETDCSDCEVFQNHTREAEKDDYQNFTDTDRN